ncbi:ATP-binding protein [Roseibium sp. RKSG952]|uniref:ATP-binding response regulator n=1 Tax=Roseibium sp. RKSG952 TaxID=2529384 RepID=UPI0018AD1FCB|nr:ATP-binding protein [Roseibium sp. RKSG952]
MIDNKTADAAALLAHDLRTPLSAMRLAAELIGTESLSDRQRERLSLLLQSIDMLSAMTDGMLGADSALVNPAPRTRSVLELIGAAAALFRLPAEQKGLDLTVDSGNISNAVAVSETAAVQRIVNALLDNAVKYTDQGSISLSVSTMRDTEGREMLRLSISDTGCGITSEERARLFQPFMRGEAGRARCKGDGLGLWGVRRWVGELGGELSVESRVGTGSRFEVRLPLSEPAASVCSEPAQERISQQKPPLAGHVLIVDDNMVNRQLMGAMLDAFGLTYEDADSGAAGLAKLGEGRFDVALLDLHMPDMSGIETARRATGMAGKGHAPVFIAVTASPEKVEPDRLREAGIAGLVAKPFRADDLYRVLSAHIHQG